MELMSRLKMDRPFPAKAAGFTMIETMLALLIVSISLIVFTAAVPSVSPAAFSRSLVRFLEIEQNEAIAQRQRRTIRIASDQIVSSSRSLPVPAGISCSAGEYSFNSQGHISTGGTIHCFSRSQSSRIVLQVASGRMRIDHEPAR